MPLASTRWREEGKRLKDREGEQRERKLGKRGRRGNNERKIGERKESKGEGN